MTRALIPAFATMGGLAVALAACSSDETTLVPGPGAGGAAAAAAAGGTGGSAAGGAGATGGGGSSTGGSAAGGSGMGGSGTGGSGMGGSGTGGSGTGGSGTGGSGTGGSVPVQPYLVSIDHAASPSKLLKIDVQTGAGILVCELPAGVDAINYHSSTFSRNDTLFASNYQNATLDVIDPCTCAVSQVGTTGVGSIPGITADYALGLYGIDTSNDLLVALDPDTAAGSAVGALGVDFGTSGATWSDLLQGGYGGLYAINGTTNQLYTIDRDNGAAAVVVGISGLVFGSVGIELHPDSGIIYACTSDAVLYSIDPGTGQATAIGSGMGHVGSCNNLAAPWKHIACLEAL